MTPAERPALDWRAEALRQRLDPLLPGIGVEVLARVDSTSSELMRRLRAVTDRGRADVGPTLLVAGHQTRGRGRQGRHWLASPGASLTFSLALPLAPADWSGLSIAVGVALAEALDPPVRSAGGAPRIGLKWPNDLWLWDGPGRGRKLGGILVETVTVGRERIAVVGVGLNLRPLDATLPAAGQLSQGYGCLAEVAPGATAPTVLAGVAPALAAGLLDFAVNGLATCRGAFARRDVLAGQTIATLDAEGRTARVGTGDGVDPHGALRLRTPQGTQAIISGEVSVRLPAGLDAAAPIASDRPC